MLRKTSLSHLTGLAKHVHSPTSLGKILSVDVSTPTQTLPTIEPNVLKFVLYDSITANKFILLLADAFNLNKHCE